MIFVITISGLAVNPLQKGTDVIYNNDVVQHISKIKSNDSDALWIVVNDRSQIHNIPIMVGAKTINSTNTYPNMDTWHKIDPDGKYQDIYNRYAHIHADVTEWETNFVLNAPDNFTVLVNQKDLEKLNVTYILSDKPLDQYEFTLVSSPSNYYIYKVK